MPPLLPDSSALIDDGHGETAGLTLDTRRLREISIQAIVEGSARARLGRAMNVRTTIAAQSLNLEVVKSLNSLDPPVRETPQDGSGRPKLSTCLARPVAMYRSDSIPVLKDCAYPSHPSPFAFPIVTELSSQKADRS